MPPIYNKTPEIAAETGNPETAGQPSIVIHDRNPILAEALRSLICQDRVLAPYRTSVVDLATLQSLPRTGPDILIVDPWEDGAPVPGVSAALSGLPPKTFVICYSNVSPHTQPQAIDFVRFRAVVPKTSPAEELVRIVCAVGFGGTYLPPAPSQSEPEPYRVGASVASLSDREVDVLRQIALGRSLKEIAASLHLSTKSIDTYKSRATQKLHLRSRSDIVKFAMQSGWMN